VSSARSLIERRTHLFTDCMMRSETDKSRAFSFRISDSLTDSCRILPRTSCAGKRRTPTRQIFALCRMSGSIDSACAGSNSPCAWHEPTFPILSASHLRVWLESQGERASLRVRSVTDHARVSRVFQSRRKIYPRATRECGPSCCGNPPRLRRPVPGQFCVHRAVRSQKSGATSQRIAGNKARRTAECALPDQQHAPPGCRQGTDSGVTTRFVPNCTLRVATRVRGLTENASPNKLRFTAQRNGQIAGSGSPNSISIQSSESFSSVFITAIDDGSLPS